MSALAHVKAIIVKTKISQPLRKAVFFSAEGVFHGLIFLLKNSFPLSLC